MPRLYVQPEQLGGSAIVLHDADYRYLVRVLRLGPGDSVVLFDGVGQEYDATLEQVGRNRVQLGIRNKRSSASESRLTTQLLVGLPKGSKMDFIVEKTTELGVSAIAPLILDRSVPQPESMARRKQLHRWTQIARQAARQSGRAQVPAISLPIGLDEALAALAPATTRLLFDVNDQAKPFAIERPASETAHVVALVGPEGGLSPGERRNVQDHGFEAVGLGPRTLRVETAAIAAVAIVSYVLGDLGPSMRQSGARARFEDQ